MASDFDYGSLQDIAHRPWPLPQQPWVMTQSWHQLLFAHWQVPVQSIAEKLPPGIEIDLFDGRAWIAVVPFWMSNVMPRGLRWLRGLSTFPELNVRTYVTVKGRPGVFFFSLDAASPLAVATARHFFHLPYYHAALTVEETAAGDISYTCDRIPAIGEPPARFAGRYRPVGSRFHAQPGTLDYFLTERYCLYSWRRGRPIVVDIHHRPWPLRHAEAEIEVNTMVAAAGIPLGSETPVLHFAERMDVVNWAPRPA